MSDESNPLRLSDIQTTWHNVSDTTRFVSIYGPAMLRYLRARDMLADRDDAFDVLQEVLTQMTEKGFGTFDPAKGRFRDYLKAVVRHSASTWERKRKRDGRPAGAEALDGLARPEPDEAETAWKEGWRGCVLDQALRALERHEHDAGRGNLAYTAVRLLIDNPAADSPRLAALATQKTGQSITAEAFRKQLSRARRVFAEKIVEVVRGTLDAADDGEILDELAELGLLGYVREYLPE